MAYTMLVLAAVVGAGMTLRSGEEKSRVLSTYAVATAVVTLADWIAFGWFHLYAYQPGILPNRVMDEALGELMADMLFVPSLAVILARFLPGTSGIIAGTGLVVALEILYAYLGVYTEQGWSPWYSAALFPIYFWAIGRFWRAADPFPLVRGREAVWVRICLLFTFVALLTLYLRGAQLVQTQIAIMPTRMGNQALGRFLVYVPITVPLGYWVVIGTGWSRWRRAAVTAVTLTLLNVVMIAPGFMRFVPPWCGTFDTIGEMGAILLAAFCQDGIQALALREFRWRQPL